MSRRTAALRFVPLALLAVALAGPPANAAPRRAVIKDTELAIAATDGAVQCMMKRNPGQVRAYLGTTPGSDAEDRIAAYLFRRMGECLTRATFVRMNEAMARGIAAERLLAIDFGSPAAAGPAAVGPDSFGPLSRPLDVDPEIGAGYSLARCAVVNDSAAVAAVIAAPRGSAAETAAFRSLGPALRNCVVAGATLKTNRWTLRPFLAEALYQLYRARGGASSSTGSL